MGFREPRIIEGDKPMELLVKKIKNLGLNNLLLVIDENILKLRLADELIGLINENNINYRVFSSFEPNPKIKNVEAGLKEYYDYHSQAIIAFGGGSAMDCAKAIGARVAKPNKSIRELRGLLKLNKKIPPLFAIPTTAGTGSEATIAAVITDEETNYKCSINDLHLIPSYAVLDPSLTLGLPKSITAYTGMDALTHAVEGFITRDCPKKYKKLAVEAIKAILNNMDTVYDDGRNIEARASMLKASYKAGVVFTRVGLTYVHPIAHTLGGLYEVQHGLANAVILPICLRYYGKKVYKKLAYLADECGISFSYMYEKDKANAFISRIEDLNNYLGLSRKFDIKEEDIPKMIKWATKEANSAYNPPVYLNEKDLEKIIRQIKK